MASSGSSSKFHKAPDPCPICLETVKNEAYLDACFHSFCYACIVRWSNVVAKKDTRPQSSIKCPLCKTENFSIVHGFNGEYFQRHPFGQGCRQSCLSSAHDFRLQWYSSKARVPIAPASDTHLYWKCRKYLRRNTWLESWLRREIQALTQDQDVDVIVHHIHGAIESFLWRQQQQQRDGAKDRTPDEMRKAFRRLLGDAARPFLLGREDRFVDEVEAFLVRGLNIEAYDELCMQIFKGIAATSAECIRE